MLRNEIDFKNIENILRDAYDTMKLYQTWSNFIEEIERLKQTKIDHSLRPYSQYNPWDLYQDIMIGDY
jgi:hypothetical protein